MPKQRRPESFFQLFGKQEHLTINREETPEETLHILKEHHEKHPHLSYALIECTDGTALLITMGTTEQISPILAEVAARAPKCTRTISPKVRREVKNNALPHL